MLRVDTTNRHYADGSRLDDTGNPSSHIADQYCNVYRRRGRIRARAAGHRGDPACGEPSPRPERSNPAPVSLK